MNQPSRNDTGGTVPAVTQDRQKSNQSLRRIKDEVEKRLQASKFTCDACGRDPIFKIVQIERPDGVFSIRIEGPCTHFAPELASIVKVATFVAGKANDRY